MRSSPGLQSDRAAGRAARSCCSQATRASGGHCADLRTRSCRASAWLGPDRPGKWSVRASYGLFYDQFQNGSGTASQVAISSLPAAQFNQFSGAGPEFPESVSGPRRTRSRTLRAAVDGLRDRHGREAALRAELEPERAALALRQAISSRCATSAPTASTCRATSKPTPRSTGPARRRRTPIGAASTPTARADGGTCDFSTIAMLRNITSSYHAGQASLSRRFGVGRRLQRVVLVTRSRSTTCRR